MDIGQRIKQLRIQNGLTLEELASRTELTKGFLSQLERNLASPSIQTLEDVTEALGVDMARFFTEEKEEQVVFTPMDAFEDVQEDKILHWIVPNAQKNEMEPIILELQPHARSKEIMPHDGEEFGYVLSGHVYLCFLNNKKGQAMKKGDTFYMKGDREHYLENRGERKVTILWVTTPPCF